jgi:hypothetical protein
MRERLRGEGRASDTSAGTGFRSPFKPNPSYGDSWCQLVPYGSEASRRSTLSAALDIFRVRPLPVGSRMCLGGTGGGEGCARGGTTEAMCRAGFG